MNWLLNKIPTTLKWWQATVVTVFIVIILGQIMGRRPRKSRKYSAKGKTILVTGANCGIGKAVATEFARADARVILACRDIDKAKNAVFDIRRETTKGSLIIKHLDLASLNSVKAFVDDILSSEERLDVLINNAGVMGVPYSLSEDGHEITFAVNYLGHFLLTNLLLDLLKNSQPSRVIMVSSMLYKYGKINFSDLNGAEEYNGSKAYSQSKLANILFAHILSDKLKGTGVTVNTVSPGFVKTNLSRHMIGNSILKTALFHTIGRLVWSSPKKGSETLLYCALEPDLAEVTGKFFRDCTEKKLMPNARDDNVALKLWEIGEIFTSRFM